MAGTHFDGLDEYVLNNIFNILYEDYDLEAIEALQTFSEMCCIVGEEYILKFYQRERDEYGAICWKEIEEDEKYWNEQVEWLNARE